MITTIKTETETETTVTDVTITVYNQDTTAMATTQAKLPQKQQKTVAKNIFKIRKLDPFPTTTTVTVTTDTTIRRQKMRHTPHKH